MNQIRTTRIVSTIFWRIVQLSIALGVSAFIASWAILLYEAGHRS